MSGLGLLVKRTMSSGRRYLIEEPRYAFLKELGLQEHNPGAFNGEWFAHGEVSPPSSISDDG